MIYQSFRTKLFQSFGPPCISYTVYHILYMLWTILFGYSQERHFACIMSHPYRKTEVEYFIDKTDFCKATLKQLQSIIYRCIDNYDRFMHVCTVCRYACYVTHRGYYKLFDINTLAAKLEMVLDSFSRNGKRLKYII